MENENEFELMRMRIMSDVNVRFDEVIKELNEKGTEYARRLKAEMAELKEKTKRDIEELLSWSKSHLLSIEQTHKTVYDPKDGIMTMALKKVELAVKMAVDAAECTAAARKAADDAKLYIRANIFVTAITFLGILVTVVGGYLAFIGKSQSEVRQGKEMVDALQKKLIQDDQNQKQLMEALSVMMHDLKK